MIANVTVKVLSHTKYLCLIREVTARFCSICGLDEEVTGNIRLAVDEACSNVIKHAYLGDTSRRIVVKYAVSKKEIRVVIEDSGKKTLPEMLKGRDLNEVRPGGLGVHFIRRVFDQVTLDPKKKRGNRLLLIRRTGEQNGL